MASSDSRTAGSCSDFIGVRGFPGNDGARSALLGESSVDSLAERPLKLREVLARIVKQGRSIFIHCQTFSFYRRSDVMRLPRLFWLTLSAAVVAGVAKAAGEAPALDLLGAVKSAIENNPQLRSQNMQVDISRGQLQQAGGQFDATLSGTASSGKVLQETPVAGGSLF